MASFTTMAQFIERSIEQKLIPGAAVAVMSHGEIVYKQAFGSSFPARELAMTSDTLFDVASLTKVMATLPAVLLCLERGLLDLDDSVAYYLPAFQAIHSDVTIKQLLTHTSGFVPFLRFDTLALQEAKAIERIARTPKQQPAQTAVIYSDLNFIVLKAIVELVTQQSFASFVATNIYMPTRMASTCFQPQHATRHGIAPTEKNEAGQYTWGVVHDENARYFGGVSGHAGLFSTVEDAVRYGQLYLTNGMLLQPATIALATQNYTAALNDARALGWECAASGKFCGQYINDGFGHTGFTGTSLWISPQRQLVIALFTNRVHYGRDRQIQRFRRIVHNCIALAVEE